MTTIGVGTQVAAGLSTPPTGRCTGHRLRCEVKLLADAERSAGHRIGARAVEAWRLVELAQSGAPPASAGTGIPLELM